MPTTRPPLPEPLRRLMQVVVPIVERLVREERDAERKAS